MKKLFVATFLAILVSTTFLGIASADEAKKIRVLLATGGHPFDTKEFFALFDAMPDIVYTKAEFPQAFDLLKPGLEKEYDVVVRYDMVQKKAAEQNQISAEQKEAFVELLNTGIGLVSLHHNIGAHYNWPEYVKIIGGKWLFKEEEIDGRKYPKSTFQHGQDIKIAVADKDHPITQGVSDFTIRDEIYGGFYVSPQVHVLLTTDHPQNSHQVAWTTQYGKSPVAYLQLGHDAEAYADPNYARLVHNAILWAAAAAK